MTPATLAQLHAACFTTPRPWRAEEFADLLSASGVFLIQAQGGFALGRQAGPEAELLTLAVSPTLRRRGIGAGLLMDFLTQAAARGCTETFLEVAADNVAAISLYSSNGFVRAGLRKAYYQHGDGTALDALVMRCSELDI